MSRFGAIIEQAKGQKSLEPENQKTRKPENQKTVKPEIKAVQKEREVNLSIKVPESRRRHWSAEAKRQGTTITAVVMESLSKRFGEPE